MHTAWQVDDILASILKHCDRKSVGRAAYVCKAWSEPASDIVWKRVSRLYALLELLGPLVNSDKGWVYTEPYTPKNWTRFLQHASRVREIEYIPPNDDDRLISPDTFTLLASTRPTLLLTPNLQSLCWLIERNLSLAYLHLFISPSLKTLHIILEPDVDPNTFRDFLSSIPDRCPELTKLHLDFTMSIRLLEPQICSMLSRLTKLKIIWLPAFCFSGNVLKALASLRFLTEISSKAFWGSRYFGLVEDVRDMDISSLPEDSYPALRNLDLEIGFSAAERLLSGPQISRALNRLYISTVEEEPLKNLKQLLTFISTEFTDLTYLALTYLVKPNLSATNNNDAAGPVVEDADNRDARRSYTEIDFDIIRPVLKLKKLTTFLFMYNQPVTLSSADILSIGEAWAGTPLRHLRLTPDPVPNISGETNGLAPAAIAELTKTGNSLETLVELAKALPGIEHLELYLDASKGLPESLKPPPGVQFTKLHTLDIGTSPLPSSTASTTPSTLTGDIAQFLSLLIPRTPLTLAIQPGWSLSWSCVSSDFDNSILASRRRDWAKVAEMHGRICRVRKECEVEIEMLRREVRGRVEEVEKLTGELVDVRKGVGCDAWDLNV